MIGQPKMLVQALRVAAENPIVERLKAELMEDAAATIDDLLLEIDDLKLELKEANSR